jgi:hypothetical protein
MKMWFPNKPQWVTLWAVLVLANGLWFVSSTSDNVLPPITFIIVSGLFIVWMIEGRRHNNP